MEEFRDERLGKIMSWMQSWIRGYLSRKEYKKIQEQRLALQVVQRNLRKYMQLRTWPWWKLWQKVKPLLNVTRVEDEIAVSNILLSTLKKDNIDVRFGRVTNSSIIGQKFSFNYISISTMQGILHKSATIYFTEIYSHSVFSLKSFMANNKKQINHFHGENDH